MKKIFGANPYNVIAMIIMGIIWIGVCIYIIATQKS